MGEALSGVGQNDDAAVAYKTSVILDDDYIEAYFELGLSYFTLKEYDKAVESFRKGLSLNPENGPEFFYHLGRSHAAAGTKAC